MGISEYGDPDHRSVERDDGVSVSNTFRGARAETVVQAGVIHGGVTFTSGVAAPTALRQLPRRLPEFTGRSQDLSALLAGLRPAAEAMPVAVSVISGLAGVGKTALAVHAAHAAVEAGWFPGGVLFIDLHGYDEPVDAHRVLDSLLRALGVPGPHIPPELEARTGLYRSLLAKRDGPVLVLLDNASAVQQVEPMLPGDDRHRVLVTSRHTLHLSSRRYELGLLPQEAAVDLLTAVLRTAAPSDSRIALDDPLVAEVVEHCGRLPLALQIVGALMVADPAMPLAELAADLAEESWRLAQLDDGERAVRSAFELSFRLLPPDQAQVFRLLAFIPGPDFDLAAAVALAEAPVHQVRRWLAELLRAHMVQRAPASHRWSMHDLLRGYARTLLGQDPESERRHADRMFDHYLKGAREADGRLGYARENGRPAGPLPGSGLEASAPEYGVRQTALAWFEAERVNLQMCVFKAAEAGDGRHACAIAHATAGFLRIAGYRQQAVVVHRVAVESALTSEGTPSRATALTDLGAALRTVGGLAESAAILAEASQLYADLQDESGQAWALTELGVAQRLAGQYPEAIETLTRVLEMHDELDDSSGCAAALSCLGATLRLTGALQASLEKLVRALQLYRHLGDELGAAQVLNTVGAVEREVGDYPRATNSFTLALETHRALGDRLGEAAALNGIGAVHWLTGDLPEAVGSLGAALQLYKDLDDALGQAHVLTFLGAVQRDGRELEEAENSLGRALVIYREVGDRGAEVEALNHYAELKTISGEPSCARKLHRKALTLAREIHSRWDEANTLRGLAATHRAEGDKEAAKALFGEALGLYESMGCAADARHLRAELDCLRQDGSQRPGGF
ncbi:tetratricopeptide repeat protein [Streptomyces griseus]|uniref:tetratricopeptide repeat protein n=1 Tax=Streptomyces griseus TaxID=1911 RepID=UPI0037F589C3